MNVCIFPKPFTWYEFTKRIIDIVGASACIILFSPVIVLASILIKIDSEGPVFYCQKRCGKDGKEFCMMKLRSMVYNADDLKPTLQNEVEGSVFKIKNDPRVTRIGSFLRKASIDELLQLLNVLRGDMSLVGPRPLAAEEMEGDSEWKKSRLSVKPGITGLWQIKCRGSEKFEDWIKYDTEYVRKKSLFLDMKILFATIPAVLKGRGAH